MSETVRVQAVKQFEQLNLQLDNELQELVAIASEICDTPIALISLLDEHTQWIKVSRGINIESAPRQISFCNHIIQSHNVLIIPDTLLDERVANHPLVLGGPSLRFYAGTPLINRDGLVLGTFCVAHSKPHNLDKHQQMMLKMLSKQAMSIMELKLNHQQLEKNRQQAEQQKQTIINAEIRLRSFFESSANLHVLLDASGQVLDYNKTAYNFVRKVHSTKLSRGDLFITYLATSFINTFLEKFNLALAGKKSYAEGLTNYGELGEVWWEANFAPAWNAVNEVIGVSYSLRNVTERKLYEQQILAQNQSLVNIAHIQSHEYRGPLTSIMGMMNLIKEEGYQPPVEYLKLLEVAINKLDEKIRAIVIHVNNRDLNNESDTKLF
ncbi:GAF domain-containing protein [Mucilaginibacter gracilis]|uniref:GAF domain-containing protein n=1 Tax=Mucilaginibacter gracilis TaxID=423350 RepID=A0A495JA27_9SPHI|nr:GAF domain-containing protein [Mucilaginibacter gracilis]RKR84919.1 GAF domain-containing protein [Mucilaginibacter gracilis]